MEQIGSHPVDQKNACVCVAANAWRIMAATVRIEGSFIIPDRYQDAEKGNGRTRMLTALCRSMFEVDGPPRPLTPTQTPTSCPALILL